MVNKTIKVLLVIVVFIEVVYASELNLNSKRYILYNMNDNVILDSKDEHDEVSIASLTKIMTVIVAIENIDNFDEIITIKNSMINDIDWDVAKVGFKVGEKVTYNDLLYASILYSGTDAVNALAESIKGSRQEFVDLMNQKVKELSLENTHFSNVVGLYSKDNYSSAYDMAQILIYALKNNKFREVFETKTYILSNGKKIKSTIESYNKKMNRDISFIKGAKTGYINKSGYCLASIASLNGVNYLLITLNAYSDSYTVHIKDHIDAYNYYNDNYSYKYIVCDEDTIVSLKTKYAKEKTIDIKANTNIKKYLNNSFDKSKIEYDYFGNDEISYFLKKNTKLGKVKIKYNNEYIDEFDLIYYGALTFSLKDYLLDNKYSLILLIVFIILITYTKIFNRKKQLKS